MINTLLISTVLSLIFSMPFDDGKVVGISGPAAFFDGINSRIIVPSEKAPLLKGSFTIDVWVCPVAFPKSPCPIVCRQDDADSGGYSLWIDNRGFVHFKVAAAGEWINADSNVAIELRKWSRLSCCFNAGNSINLSINGIEVANTTMELPYLKMGEWDMWIGRTKQKMPSFFEAKNIPIYSSFDGAIDELKFFDGTRDYDTIISQEFIRPEAPAFEDRVLPSGPAGDMAFGSWYIPLKYYEAWDNQWRGNNPDIVVGFGSKIPFRVVFWRGISYAPCFVTEKGNWMCNEFLERSKVTGWGCPESMSDKHADFSSIKIIENTSARTVVLWRNSPVGVNQKFPYQSEETGWGDWTEETYIFYPDGVGIRKMDAWSSNLDDWYEWCQSLQVLHPYQKPEDVLDSLKIMSVANMAGESRIFGWDFNKARTQNEPTLPGANIQVTYLNSEWNPFLILDDRDGKNEKGNNGPQIVRYAGRWSEYSAFPWRNHWPVTQEYVIGRYAAVADAPSHTYTATQYNAPYYKGDGHMIKLMMCGCTNLDAADLVPLAKSWLHAPLILFDGNELEYDVTQRAYLCPDVIKQAQIKIKAGKDNPLVGLCLIMPQWTGNKDVTVSLNGEKLENDKIKAGFNQTLDGETMILWVDVNLNKPSTLDLR